MCLIAWCWQHTLTLHESCEAKTSPLQRHVCLTPYPTHTAKYTSTQVSPWLAVFFVARVKSVCRCTPTVLTCAGAVYPSITAPCQTGRSITLSKRACRSSPDASKQSMPRKLERHRIVRCSAARCGHMCILRSQEFADSSRGCS